MPALFQPAPASDAAEPIDFWRSVAHRGVFALGFRQSQGDMIAELVAPQRGWVRRAAHAAIEIHKLIVIEPGSAAFAAREALAQELIRGPAARQLAIYQGLLLERLWREIKDAPPAALEGLAYPHED